MPQLRRVSPSTTSHRRHSSHDRQSPLTSRVGFSVSGEMSGRLIEVSSCQSNNLFVFYILKQKEKIHIIDGAHRRSFTGIDMMIHYHPSRSMTVAQLFLEKRSTFRCQSTSRLYNKAVAFETGNQLQCESKDAGGDGQANELRSMISFHHTVPRVVFILRFGSGNDINHQSISLCWPTGGKSIELPWTGQTMLSNDSCAHLPGTHTHTNWIKKLASSDNQSGCLELGRRDCSLPGTQWPIEPSPPGPSDSARGYRRRRRVTRVRQLRKKLVPWRRKIPHR